MPFFLSWYNVKQLLRENKWLSATLIISLLLIVSAIAHQIQYVTQPFKSYLNSPLLFIIAPSIIILPFMNAVNSLLILIDLVRRNWREAVITLGITTLSVILLILVFIIDYPIMFSDP